MPAAVKQAVLLPVHLSNLVNMSFLPLRGTRKDLGHVFPNPADRTLPCAARLLQRKPNPLNAKQIPAHPTQAGVGLSPCGAASSSLSSLPVTDAVRGSPASQQQQQQRRKSVACSLATGGTIHHLVCHGGIPGSDTYRPFLWIPNSYLTEIFDSI